MKTIGLLGGMSWESSAEYYRIINETVKKRLGGLHSASCILYSVDFAEIEALQQTGRWDETGASLAGAAQALERAGADLLIICTITMHKLADAVQARIEIPLLHIADATAQRIKIAGLGRIGLLGTRFTMEETFYRDRLIGSGLDVLIPEAIGREMVHHVIYDELCLGLIKTDSKANYLAVIDQLVAGGAEGVILGCTEIGLLIGPEDCRTPLFDTTRIHAEAAVDYALFT